MNYFPERGEPTGICELCGHAQFGKFATHTILCVRFQELEKKHEELLKKFEEHTKTLGNH